MNRNYTYLGLFISYFSIILIGGSAKMVHGVPLDDLWTVIREVVTLLAVLLLLWIIKNKEHLTLDSIGISDFSWKQTALWSLIFFVFCMVGAFATLGILQVLGIKFGSNEPKAKLSLITTTLVMVRAGIAEEVFFRGYIYERLRSILQNKWIAVALSVIPFALLHFSAGVGGIIMAFVLGSILTATYLWKRNLKANIIAHFFVDFIPNVLIPLISG